jgi:hypothetical protein
MSYYFTGTTQHIDGRFATTYPGEPFTIAAWIRAPDWSAGDNQLFAAVHATINEFDNSIQLQAAAIADRCLASARTTASAGSSYTFTSADLYNDVWVPCVAKFSTTTSREVYVGSLSQKGDPDTVPRDVNGVQYVIIGQRYELQDAPAEAYVAHVAMWDSALSNDDITAFMNSASQADILAIDSSNLIGYWPLNVDQTTHDNLGLDSMTTDLAVANATFYADDPFTPTTLVATVERVTVDWDGASEPVTVNLSKNQNYTRCVPFFTKRLVSGSLTDDFRERTMKVEMIDNAGTPAVRVSASGKSSANDHRIEVYVVEFEPEITVQQIDADIADTSSSNNITIADVTAQANAFFMYSYQYTHGSAQDRADYGCVRPIWNGASTTSVTIERTGTVGTIDGMLYVVSCANSEFSVQHRDISVVATDELTNDTITAVPLATSFLVTHFRSSEAEDDPLDWSFVADLSSTTNVRVRRSIAGASNAAANVGVQVVTALGGQWSVQRGDFTTTSNLTETTTVSAVDRQRAFVKTGTHEAGLNSLGTSDLAAGTIIDEVGPAAYLSSNNQITWVRESVSETGNTIPYEVIQFSAGLDNPILIPTGPLR